MTDEPEVRPGWLPPRAPGTAPGEPRPVFRSPDSPQDAAASRTPYGAGPAVPATGAGTPGWRAPDRQSPTWPPPPAPPPQRPTFTTAASQGPASPLAVGSIVVGAIAIVLLVLSLGIGYVVCGLLSCVALGLALQARRRIRAGAPGRESQARAAVVLASIGVALAVIAGAIWYGLDASGYTPQDLQDWLERELDRRQEDRRPRPNPDTVEALRRSLRG